MKALIWCHRTRNSHIQYNISITTPLSILLQRKKSHVRDYLLEKVYEMVWVESNDNSFIPIDHNSVFL